MLNEGIFREYDIRGIVGKDLDRETAVYIGKALGTLVRRSNADAKYLSVGRDVRNSSAELASGVIEGITSTGLGVYDIGVCPTPLQYFSIFHLDLDGGIMITGSHNPPEYNGFKLSVGKETIYGSNIQGLKEIIKKKDWFASVKKGMVLKYDIVTAYKKYMLDKFSYLNGPQYKRLKVVVDAGNGTGGLVAPEILNNIGCYVIPLYCEPDGSFPNHHPDPTVVEYIQNLIADTKKSGADFGVGYDGDADRIGVVNRNGDIIWGDQLMVLLARDILKRNPGAKIIGDVKCSQIMFDDIKANGGVPIMWKTGHSLVKDKMRKEGALLAGEFSGHIFIADKYFGYDDAIFTTLRIVEIMKVSGFGIGELLSGIPKLYYTPEIRVDCPEDMKKKVVEKVKKRFQEHMKKGNNALKIKQLIDIDGIRAVFEKGWGLIRTSNTQPVVVMRVEAVDEESLNAYKTFLEKEFKCAMEAAG